MGLGSVKDGIAVVDLTCRIVRQATEYVNFPVFLMQEVRQIVNPKRLRPKVLTNNQYSFFLRLSLYVTFPKRLY